jgi:hypothetical protein
MKLQWFKLAKRYLLLSLEGMIRVLSMDSWQFFNATSRTTTGLKWHRCTLMESISWQLVLDNFQSESLESIFLNLIFTCHNQIIN